MNNVAENILKRSMENIKTEDVDLIPCNRNVLVEFQQQKFSMAGGQDQS